MTTYTKYTINGIQYNDVIKADVTSSIGNNNSSSSFKITFKNLDGKHNTDFNIGDEVIVYAEKDVNPATQKIITGIIEDIKFQGSGQDDTIDISGRDFTARIMDNTVEPEIYNNQEVSTIVTDIISKYVDDITTTNVDVTTTTLNHIAFNQIPVFDALKQLAELSGFIFWVDTDKDLHFSVKGGTSSGITLDNTNITKSQFRESDKELYNKIWVYGDRVLTGIENKFQQTGNGSVFNLSYKPHNTQVTVGGSVTMQGGIYEMLIGTPISGTQYLVDFDEQQIIFVSGEYAGNNIPAGNASIFVDYDRSTPIIKYGERESSISKYGPKTKIIQDTNIKDPNMATDMVVDTLNRHSEPTIQGNIYLQGTVYLVAGNTVIVNMPNQDINSITYDILEAKYTFNKKNEMSDQVLRVKVSTKLSDVVDTIKQMLLDIKNLQSSQISTADVISRMEFATGSFGVRVKNWLVKDKEINDSFILGGYQNSRLGIIAPDSIGSLVSGATWETGAGIGHDRAILFNGSNSFVKCNNIGSPFMGGPEPGSAWSVSAWINTIGSSLGISGPTQCIITVGGIGTDNSFSINNIEKNNPNGLNLRLDDSQLNSPSEIIGSNTWNHVVASVSLKDVGSPYYWEAKIHLNGSIVADTNNTGSILYRSGEKPGYSVNNGYIGFDTRFKYGFNGKIDEVRMYNSFLSNSEVGSLYDKQEVTGSLVAHWRFDEGVGSFAYNSVGSGTADGVFTQSFLGDRRSSFTNQQSGGIW